MMPLLGVALGAAILRALGAAGGRWTSWRAALVPPLVAMYILTGLASFTPIGEDLARFIPAGVPHPLLLVRLHIQQGKSRLQQLCECPPEPLGHHPPPLREW